MKDTLLLTLSKKPFEVMVTGEKTVEIRKPSDWIKSRLYNKDGSRRKYKFVKFVNGYGHDKPYFIAKYLDFEMAIFSLYLQYTNGLYVCVQVGDFIINLGEVVERGNLK